MIKESETKKYLKFYQSKFGKEVLEKELEFVESKLKDCRNVLSVGCGPAFLEAGLHQLHPEMRIIGLDNSREMIVQASKSIYIEYGDAQHLRFDDNFFDAVLFITSLEFIDDYIKAVEEAHRVLKLKGTILILMLNPQSQYFRDKYRDNSSYIRMNIKHMNIREIKEFMSRCFFIENEEYFLGIKNGKIFDSNNPKVASLYILEGIKYDE